MALNLSTLKTRTLTAAVFVVVMMTGLLYNAWSFFVLFSIIHFGCWYEYQKIITLIDSNYSKISRFHKYGVMIAGWCLMLYMTNKEGFRIGGISLHSVGWWAGLAFLFVLPVGEILLSRQLNGKNILYSVYGLLYISLSFGLLMHLRSVFQGSPGFWAEKAPVLMIIGSIWINDTMAYIVGSLIGKTPLSKISPKKTWEGTVGGIILAVAVMGIAGYFANQSIEWEIFSPTQWMIIAAVAAVAGTFGDLLESKLKRMAGVKDSGHLMPGHGGFLDRFDSLLVATPFVWLYIIWVVG
ncbi:phosphatidate cytidylyltransferase [Flavitalea flava]